LYLAANPADTPSLRLDVECREIAATIRTGRYRDRIEFAARWAARPDDLQALNDEEPQVLHFSGHGEGAGGLWFEGADSAAQPVGADALAQVMRAAGASVRLVVLNACYSETQAEAVRAHVPCVVGISSAIGDRDGAHYAVALYRAIAFGHSVANAHAQGLAALAMHGAHDPDAVKLLCRPGTDPAQVTLVAPTPTSPPVRSSRTVTFVLAVLVLAATAAISYRMYRRDDTTWVVDFDSKPATPSDPEPDVVIQHAGPGGITSSGSGNVNTIINH